MEEVGTCGKLKNALPHVIPAYRITPPLAAFPPYLFALTFSSSFVSLPGHQLDRVGGHVGHVGLGRDLHVRRVPAGQEDPRGSRGGRVHARRQTRREVNPRHACLRCVSLALCPCC